MSYRFIIILHVSNRFFGCISESLELNWQILIGGFSGGQGHTYSKTAKSGTSLVPEFTSSVSCSSGAGNHRLRVVYKCLIAFILLRLIPFIYVII